MQHINDETQLKQRSGEIQNTEEEILQVNYLGIYLKTLVTEPWLSSSVSSGRRPNTSGLCVPFPVRAHVRSNQ